MFRRGGARGYSHNMTFKALATSSKYQISTFNTSVKFLEKSIYILVLL